MLSRLVQASPFTLHIPVAQHANWQSIIDAASCHCKIFFIDALAYARKRQAEGDACFLSIKRASDYLRESGGILMLTRPWDDRHLDDETLLAFAGMYNCGATITQDCLVHSEAARAHPLPILVQCGGGSPFGSVVNSLDLLTGGYAATDRFEGNQSNTLRHCARLQRAGLADPGVWMQDCGYDRAKELNGHLPQDYPIFFSDDEPINWRSIYSLLNGRAHCFDATTALLPAIAATDHNELARALISLHEDLCGVPA